MPLLFLLGTDEIFLFQAGFDEGEVIVAVFLELVEDFRELGESVTKIS